MLKSREPQLISTEQLSNGQYGFQDEDNQSLPELGIFDNKDDAEHHINIYNSEVKKYRNYKDDFFSKKGQ